MGFGVLLLQVVRVVRGDRGQAELGGDAQHPLRNELLLLDAVILDFEPESIRSKRPREPLGAGLRRLEIPLAQIQGDFPREAGGKANDPLVMLGQDFLVDPWPPVIALEEAYRGKLDQVLIAGAVPGEQDEV